MVALIPPERCHPRESRPKLFRGVPHLVLAAVTARAVVLDEGPVRRGRLGRTGRRDRDQGQYREPEEPWAGRDWPASEADRTAAPDCGL